jgi:hypothetical protein
VEIIRPKFYAYDSRKQATRPGAAEAPRDGVLLARDRKDDCE